MPARSRGVTFEPSMMPVSSVVNHEFCIWFLWNASILQAASSRRVISFFERLLAAVSISPGLTRSPFLSSSTPSNFFVYSITALSPLSLTESSIERTTASTAEVSSAPLRVMEERRGAKPLSLDLIICIFKSGWVRLNRILVFLYPAVCVWAGKLRFCIRPFASVFSRRPLLPRS